MQPRTSRLAIATALVLTVVTVAVFAPGLRGGFLYDDYYLVETNPTLRQPGSLAHYLSTPLFAGVEGASEHWAAGRTQYWRPFLKLAYLVQYRLFGTAPRGWHVVNLIVHVACVLMAFVWLRRRIGATRTPDTRAGRDSTRTGPLTPTPAATLAATPAATLAAALAAALFALHPSRCEAVAWVSGSADAWMTFWILVGLLAWERKSVGATALAIAAFTIAVLCKETALVVPLCLALDAWLVPAAPHEPVPAAPHAPVPAGTALQSRWRFGALLTMLVVVILARLALLPRAPGMFAGFSLSLPLASLGLYVARVLWPLHPSTQIGLMDASKRFDLEPWSIAAGLLLCIAIVALLVWLPKRRSLRPWIADTGWFLLPLAPVSNFVSLGYSTLIAERFLYLPFLGVGALAARGLWLWLRHSRSPWPALATVSAVCAVYAAICMRYLPMLRSNAALWAYEVRLAPENPLLRLYQSQAEWQAGRLEAAMAAARASYERARTEDGRAEAALSWASTRFQIATGREAPVLAALRDFFDTLATGPGPARLEVDGLLFESQPTDAFRVDLQRRTSLRLSRAVAHARTGDPVFAESLLRELARDDLSPAVAANLARVLAYQQRWDEALQVLAAARQRHPADPVLSELGAPIQVGRSLALRGEGADGNAALQRAQVWIALGSSALARRDLATLGEARAWDPEVVLWTAMADAADGDLDAARRRIETARQRQPAANDVWDDALARVQELASTAPAWTPGKPPTTPVTPLKPKSLDGLFR